jgi:hypothetical protein
VSLLSPEDGNRSSFRNAAFSGYLALRAMDEVRRPSDLEVAVYYKLRNVFENRVLRRIFGPKRDEVMGEWRKLHNEGLHDLYSSPSINRIMKSRRMR